MQIFLFSIKDLIFIIRLKLASENLACVEQGGKSVPVHNRVVAVRRRLR